MGAGHACVRACVREKTTVTPFVVGSQTKNLAPPVALPLGAHRRYLRRDARGCFRGIRFSVSPPPPFFLFFSLPVTMVPIKKKKKKRTC